MRNGHYLWLVVFDLIAVPATVFLGLLLALPVTMIIIGKMIFSSLILSFCVHALHPSSDVVKTKYLQKYTFGKT